MYKFLVIQTAFTGDVVLATAILEKIHQFYPDAQIDFLLRKGNEGLLRDHPFITNLLIWDKRKQKKRNLLKMAMRVRKEQYTHIINPHRFPTSGFMMFFSGAQYTAGFDKNPFAFSFTKKAPHNIAEPHAKEYIMEVERYQLLIEDITDKTAAQPKLYPTPGDYAAAKPYQDGPYICIAPSSVWFTKRYPAERWAELLDLLPAQYNVYLVGGPDDKELSQSIIDMSGNKKAINLSGKMNYLESCALMQGADMNYTNDSAPLHFAVAMDAPVTGVFCSTISSFGFGPTHSKGRIVEIDYPLYCRPCGLHGRKRCPEGHFKCALDIKDEQLLWWISKTT
ncbi:heptosyltransferase [Flavipsychrobacter stenotrophus]|uniref:Heptosyltransferase n=1 Tax=Flavipsychrobacter stenotrophus TaxID=2077091 RepID=A0A2S7SSA2_9BACT|nr:glycosyltransferase family 9 protein [Flavipsychrobacter stenotrophus]PQJ09783.1 heptosyltransferase [Flavipsychrobacter stenotrophus]